MISIRMYQPHLFKPTTNILIFYLFIIFKNGFNICDEYSWESDFREELQER